ncbi:rRNA pseudouridine synthase [bacterium]|nr:rRNA pseudouridine synthase [bacterium]
MAERVQKYLARCGVGSRRACEKLIEAGRVRVNGSVVALGACVEAQDEVLVDQRPVVLSSGLHYWMLNKPVGYVTSVTDPQGRDTVMRLMPKHLPRIFPVGRLDLDSMGLLLFTNDGDLTYKLLHPSGHVWKTYHCGLRSQPPESVLERVRSGLELEDGPTSPCKAQWTRGCLEIALCEGRKRQVRRMLASVGYPVEWLRRVSFGPLSLGNLPEGQCRALSEQEVEALRAAHS